MSTFSAEWDFRTATSLPPPTGKLGTNTGAWTGTSSIYLARADRNGTDQHAALAALAAGDSIKLELRNNPSGTNSNWSVSGAPEQFPDYFLFPVTAIGTPAGVPAAGNPYLVTTTSLALPYPTPEESLYWILSGSDPVKFCGDAGKLILQGFAPLGAISFSGSTYTQAFWRQNAVPTFIGRTRP